MHKVTWIASGICQRCLKLELNIELHKKILTQIEIGILGAQMWINREIVHGRRLDLLLGAQAHMMRKIYG